MEHDTPEEAHIGIDVSKGWLDAHCRPAGRGGSRTAGRAKQVHPWTCSDSHSFNCD